MARGAVQNLGGKQWWGFLLFGARAFSNLWWRYLISARFYVTDRHFSVIWFSLAFVMQCNEECYRAQCFETARRIATSLDLPKDFYSVSFQSRLTLRNTVEWIKPYTDVRIEYTYSHFNYTNNILCLASNIFLIFFVNDVVN